MGRFCSCSKKVTTSLKSDGVACAMALQENYSDTMLNFNA
jgi:hypothetical protein